MKNIRNFCIIAHIDHGKSTLADRFLEITGEWAKQRFEIKKQVLDGMDLEQEKGITIKLTPVRMWYKKHILNLIDTPGHVDFSYEVSRSLTACEGAVLVVDATQGIQAQTLANLYLAVEHDLTIIPVVNKIDLKTAEVEKTKEELKGVLGIEEEEIIAVSAKEGTNVEKVLDRIIELVPSPRGSVKKPLKALVFDSQYDSYKGAIAFVRVFDGAVENNDEILLMAEEKEGEVLELGFFKPGMVKSEKISAGEVGYIATGLKSVQDLRVGDTITLADDPAQESYGGYQAAKPMVFAGLYPVEGDDFPVLRDALEKLQLNDAALSFKPEVNPALGQGFQAGFLGLLHLEIIQERLEREFDLDLVVTTPSVGYEIVLQDQEEEEVLMLDNMSAYPDPSLVQEIREPVMKVTIITPTDYMGRVMDLVMSRRGVYKATNMIGRERLEIVFEVPLAEMLIDFYNKLKSVSQGYASMDYEFLTYRTEDLVKLDILVNQERVDVLSSIVHRDKAESRGRSILKKLKEVIPREQFKVPLQAANGGRILARENIPALRKNVTAKLYGGDVTRKRKLLKNQKKGKKRLKQVGKVTLPQEAFMAVLSEE